MKFQLEIQQIENTCLFKLIWGKGQQISSVISLPSNLSQQYQTWHQAYLGFYQTALRARVPKSKSDRLTLPQDWHRQLVQAEAQLLSTFHRWLRQSKLYEIRAKIASNSQESAAIALFITCSDELARLPWESWDIGAEFGRTVIIARSPTKINYQVQTAKRPRKPRILAILGDDTAIDLKSDRLTINTLQPLAEIEFVTWQVEQSAELIKQEIRRALTDERGWEILFFAGHSCETEITGGELAIAPSITLSISEIAEELKIAQSNGLQFALFNSCSGLSIANSLIDLGLSQVAIMREPVHNRVAQVFLAGFIQALAGNQDVHQALVYARLQLKQQNLTYPAAALIPSLFCHPDAQPYQIPPWGWRQRLNKWLPNRYEAIAVGTLCLLSLIPKVDSFLLDQRTLVQSVYRDATGQLPIANTPVTLVHIDEQSLRQAKIDRPVPMDRSYLASIIERLVAKEARIIGVDYLLDRTQPENDPILAKAIASAVESHQTWFIFGSYKLTSEQEVGVAPETNIGDANWTLQGYTDGLPGYMTLLPRSLNCSQICPFAYLLAQVRQISPATNAPIPQITSQTDLRSSIADYASRQPIGDRSITEKRLSLGTTLGQYFGQQWLRPIQDFSIPPDLVYDRLSAWKLLDPESNQDSNRVLAGQTIIIGAGGYPEAGLTMGSDNFATPQAIAYWQTRRGLKSDETPFTGSEFLAYMTHHWLEDHFVIPIPQLWLILMALLIVKSIRLNSANKVFTSRWLSILLSSGAAIYGLVALQLYISSSILLPWLLPSLTLVIMSNPRFKIN
ncbi:MAG: CHASE2 domain-containing protein [Cyanobacteria bacterium J06631_2]